MTDHTFNHLTGQYESPIPDKARHFEPVPTRPDQPYKDTAELAVLRLRITVLENENAMLRTTLKEHTREMRRRIYFDQRILGG